SEPRSLPWTRRNATVTSSLPLRATDCASFSSDGNPPVPSSRRERSSRPAITSWSSTGADPATRICSPVLISASLHRRQYLYPRALGQLQLLPARARDDLAVDGHRDPARAVRHVQLGERRRQRLRAELPRLPVQHDHLRASARSALCSSSVADPKRAGSHHESILPSSCCSPSSPRTTSSAVSGASRIPLR